VLLLDLVVDDRARRPLAEATQGEGERIAAPAI
jgi:hypothetical protein